MNWNEKSSKFFLLYGNETENFEDLVLKEDETTGDLEFGTSRTSGKSV